MTPRNHPIHLTQRKAREYGLYFDEPAADRACAFFAKVVKHGLGKWNGQPFELLPWERDEIIRPLFGWKRSKDGTRRFKKGAFWVPKKNGKTELGAAIMLLLLMADGEYGAECYAVANSREQAGLLYDSARGVVRFSPDIARRLKCLDATKVIRYLDAQGVMKVLSSEHSTAEGVRASGLFYDEIHAAPDRRLFDALTYSGAARAQPFICSISTAGLYDPDSIGWEQWEYARRVLEREIEDPYFLGYISAAQPDDDWTSPKVWRRANPSWGVTINPDDFAADAREAMNSPAKQTNFQRYRLNIWTHHISRWIPPEKWEACGGSVDESLLVGLPCWCGIDLSKKIDLTAAAFVFRDDNGLVSLVLRFWLPEAALVRREREGAAPWRLWAQQGYLTVTPGETVDYARVLSETIRDWHRFRVLSGGIDEWNAQDITQKFRLDGCDLFEVKQNIRNLAAPTKELERLIYGQELRHGDNPIMRWMISKTVVHHDQNENYKPDRDKSGGSIDGLMATLNALARMMVSEPQYVDISGM